jgi:hypothetical protein
MASQVFNAAKTRFANGGIDWDTDDIRVALVMTNTTVDTDNDGDVFVSDITTLDECDATGYARVALSGEAVNTDDTNDRAELDANDVAFSGMSGDSSRNIQGALIYKHVTNDSDSLLIAYIEFSVAINAAATAVNVPWNAEGIIQLT